MANKTPNYGLTKPLPEEFYDINVHNQNMDKIDTELKNKYDPNNKPTAADVGSVKVYTSLAELGLTESNVTMNDILAKMAVPSKLLVYTGAAWASGVVPEQNGTLVVDKIHPARASATFTSSYPLSNRYVGTATGSNTFGGWKKLYHEGNATAADMGAVSNTGGTVDGALTVNGELTVHGNGSKFKLSRGSLVAELSNLLDRLFLCSPYTSNNRRGLYLHNCENNVDIADALQLVEFTGGVEKLYNILHTGNKEQIYTYGTEDIQAGSASSYENGHLHFVIE